MTNRKVKASKKASLDKSLRAMEYGADLIIFPEEIERPNIPEYYHFDFRYLFTIDKIQNIKIDIEEISKYKWISLVELINNLNYGKIAFKIKKDDL